VTSHKALVAEGRGIFLNGLDPWGPLTKKVAHAQRTSFGAGKPESVYYRSEFSEVKKDLLQPSHAYM